MKKHFRAYPPDAPSAAPVVSGAIPPHAAAGVQTSEQTVLSPSFGKIPQSAFR